METLFLQSRIKKVFPHILNNLSPFFALFLFSLIWSSIGYSAEVSLAWDPNNEPDLVGYTLYYGTSSGSYASSIPLGKVTAYTVTNLSDGVPYYFALTARNTTGLESGYSNQVSYIPPVSQFTLTVSTTGSGSGTVIKSPAGTAFNAGTPVSLNASANANSVFTGWSGACSGTANPCSVTMSANAAVTAAFAIKTYTLTASAGSNGTIGPSGSVTVNYGGSQTYAITPAAGFNVANVLVDGVSVGAVTSYTFSSVTANHTLSATFAASSSYSLAISKSGTGAGTITGTGINCGTDCSESFSGVTSVSLTAASNSNSTFTGWGGVCSGTANTCTVNVNGSQSVTAIFALKTFTLTASAGSNGTISPSGSVTVNYGGSQTYAITPAAGFNVAKVLVDGVSVGAVTSYTFSSVTANHTLSATFAAITSADAYTLSISKIGDGQGNVSNNPGGKTFKKGTKVTLTASPSANSFFSEWGGACSGTASTCTVTMNTNKTATASFSLKKYGITALAGPNGFIAPEGTTTVSYGTNQTYNIQAASGYQISEVKVDGVSVGGVSSYSFKNIKADHQISASFTSKSKNSPPHSLNISKKGSGKGMVKSTPEGATFYDNTVVTLTATPEGDSIFIGWSGACVGEDPQCTITMSSDLSLTATFDVKPPSKYKNYLPIILN